MKHTYIAPKSNVVQLRIESGILAASSPRAYDVVSNDPQLSNAKGWNSGNWTATDDED